MFRAAARLAPRILNPTLHARTPLGLRPALRHLAAPTAPASSTPAAPAAPSNPGGFGDAGAAASDAASATAGPSTAHALPLTGGNTTQQARQSTHADILARYRQIAQPPPRAQLHPADVVPSATAVFVGVGLHTNWPGVLAGMHAHVFAGRRVVAVRDVFDRSPGRECLSDWLAVVADDVVAVDADVVRPDLLRRRFVNEYVVSDGAGAGESYGAAGAAGGAPMQGGAYRIAQNDVDLVEFLHAQGFRVVPVSGKAELNAMRDGQLPIPPQQSTNHVLLCAPTAFQYNAGAAADNHFMPSGGLSEVIDAVEGAGAGAGNGKATALRRQVLSEFAALHDVLTRKDEAGVGAQVHLFTHEDWHETPDAVFPNNTFSTHTNLETGDACTLVLYPMKEESRRRERRLVQRLLLRGRYTQIYDLTREELGRGNGGADSGAAFLEGTGSLVLDRVQRIAYVALSQRSDLRLARAWARVMDYTVVPFTATDRAGRPIYHTNVMLSVGTRVAVVCGESIADGRERELVMGTLRESGKTVVDISYEQVEKFCGNVLELESFYGEQVMVMSSGAHGAFNEKQREMLLSGVKSLVHADISTIERVGGGGVRCTIAELF